jgi:hypothetical protein
MRSNIGGRGARLEPSLRPSTDVDVSRRVTALEGYGRLDTRPVRRARETLDLR